MADNISARADIEVIKSRLDTILEGQEKIEQILTGTAERLRQIELTQVALVNNGENVDNEIKELKGRVGKLEAQAPRWTMMTSIMVTVGLIILGLLVTLGYQWLTHTGEGGQMLQNAATQIPLIITATPHP
jgi:hypothetical protein